MPKTSNFYTLKPISQNKENKFNYNITYQYGKHEYHKFSTELTIEFTTFG